MSLLINYYAVFIEYTKTILRNFFNHILLELNILIDNFIYFILALIAMKLLKFVSSVYMLHLKEFIFFRKLVFSTSSSVLIDNTFFLLFL